MLVPPVGTTGVGQGLTCCPLGISGGSHVLGEAVSPLEITPTQHGYTPRAATHPGFANNYCYLHITREYGADEKHKRPLKPSAIAQIEAVAQIKAVAQALQQPRFGFSCRT